MKKILAFVLTVVLMVSLSVTVWADNKSLSNGNDSLDIDVGWEYDAAESTGTIYSVDVTWGSLVYVYKEGSPGEWDPATHTYGDPAAGEWVAKDEGTSDQITITNHSNASIVYQLSFASDYNVTGRFTNSSGTLPSAEEKEFDDSSLIETSTLSISGIFSAMLEEKNDPTLGTITVIISGTT